MSKVAKATLGLMIATMIGKVLGFGRELVLASTYGATMYSDAYLVSMNIPLVIFTAIGGALTTTLIPMYFEVSNNLGEEKALKFINNISNIVILICIFLAIVGLFFTEQLVMLFAYGFNAETFKLAINFTQILILGIVFNGLSFIMTAYLQIKNNFTIPGLISVPKNIIVIISILLSITYGPYTMIWGTLIGTFIEFIFQLPFAFKYGYKYQLYLNVRDVYVKKMIKLLGPVIIGVAVVQINSMIDKSLASGLDEGAISALNYANKLNGFVIAIFITSIVSVIYPKLSKLSNEDDRDKLAKFISRYINSVTILVLPISVGAIVLSTPIVKLLLQRGEFDERATKLTAIALAMYSIGMVATGLREILSKVFYSLKDTKIPMINGVMAMITNIVLNIILVRYLGIAGLALSTSISSIICIILLFVSLYRKIGYFGQDKIIKTTFKSIISSVIMGIITYFIYKTLSNLLGIGIINEGITLVASIVIGSIVYGALLIVLKVDEINLIMDMIKKKNNNS